LGHGPLLFDELFFQQEDMKEGKHEMWEGKIRESLRAIFCFFLFSCFPV
jgi:hypothetical protein